MKLVLLGIIAPEYILLWAMNQKLVARQIAMRAPKGGVPLHRRNTKIEVY